MVRSLAEGGVIGFELGKGRIKDFQGARFLFGRCASGLRLDYQGDDGEKSWKVTRKKHIGEPEGVGFEPTRAFALPVFKTGAINHSTTPPGSGRSAAETRGT